MQLSDLAFRQPVVGLWPVHPGDLLGEPIEFLTHGPISHAGWLRSDKVRICEAYLPRVRCRPVLAAEKPGLRLFALEGMTPETAARFERFFDISTDPKLAEAYSVPGLFGYLFNVAPPTEQNVFCSEFVMQGIHKVAPELLPLVRCGDYQVSPVNLYQSPRLHEVEWDWGTGQGCPANRQAGCLPYGAK